MIELHGWVTIRETYEAVDDEEDNIDIIVKEISVITESLSYLPPIKVQNGEHFLEFSLFCNHRNSQVEDILNLFNQIGKIAKGSYGLIYMHDDEDINGKDNQFQVFALVRGEVRAENDLFLSPVIPKLEDEYKY